MKKTISVVGLGFIGLPLSLSFCEKGLQVIGIDVDHRKIEQLLQGQTSVHEDYQGETLSSILQRHLQSGRFTPTSSWQDTRASQAFIVTVGIPVSLDGELNTAPLFHAMEDLGQAIKPGDLVLIRSTLVPGMMEKELIPRLKAKSGMEPGVDFHVAYAAERVAEGRAMYEFQTLDIVLGGYTESCAQAAKELLGELTSGQLHITTLSVAEAVKVVENAQRDVNIALAQQLARYSEARNMNVYELIRMANTHPRVHLLEPGIGVGGYCIPNAYHYLNASLDDENAMPLFRLARQINTYVTDYLMDRMAGELTDIGKSIANSHVAVLGLGMKDGSNDTRNSPAVDCTELLISYGAKVKAYDPTVTEMLPYQVESLEECLTGADAILVGTWQPEFSNVDWAKALRQCKPDVVLVDLKDRLTPYVAPYPSEVKNG